jgi:hypothetical protein
MNKKQIFIFILITTLTGSVFGGPNEDLLDAITKNNISNVKNALTKGADVNAKDQFGKTTVNYADGNEKIKALLKKK